jgi:hypothetical protein
MIELADKFVHSILIRVMIRKKHFRRTIAINQFFNSCAANTNAYPLGFLHIDIAEARTEEGKLYLFVAIDRTSKFAVAQLVEKANRKTAWESLEHFLEAVPFKLHTILTDNGIQFAEQPRNRNTAYSRPMRFDMICEANGIEHRLTKPNHPWTRRGITAPQLPHRRRSALSPNQLVLHSAKMTFSRGTQTFLRVTSRSALQHHLLF